MKIKEITPMLEKTPDKIDEKTTPKTCCQVMRNMTIDQIGNMEVEIDENEIKRLIFLTNLSLTKTEVERMASDIADSIKNGQIIKEVEK